MQKIQFENNNFILYAPDSLNYITKDLETILNESLNLYKNIFNVDDFRKVEINYFDNLDEFRNFIYELRGGKESLPKYARGTFDNGMINAYIEPNIIVDTPLYKKRKYSASHELFHIMYEELILEKYNMQRIVWFDEGMAQFFSGEYSNELSEERYNGFLTDIIAKLNVIPNLNSLSHGSLFETKDYNGYRLSLIAIKYLYDKLGLQEFKKILYDNDRIIKYGKNVIDDVINCYRDNIVKKL